MLVRPARSSEFGAGAEAFEAPFPTTAGARPADAYPPAGSDLLRIRLR